MLSESIKEKIFQHLKYIATDNKKLVGICMAEFMKDFDKKTDEEIVAIVKEIKATIAQNRSFAIQQFGYSYNFFNSMLIVDISFKDFLEPHVSMREMKKNDDILNKLAEILKPLQRFAPGACINGNTSNTASPTGEPIIKSTRDKHIDEVGQCYESFKQLLHCLFADMQPTSFSELVNNRISEVYKKLADLRNLACKHLPA